MKKMNKWFYAFIGTAVLLVAAIVVAIVLGVGQGSDGPEGPVTEGPESGVYYYDVAEGEVVISLHGGNKFTIAGPGYNKSGEYTTDGSNLSLDFFRDEDGNATAVLNGNTLAVTHNGSTTEYLKKVAYVVSFNTAGGSSVAPVTVINGKTLAAPADPSKDGNVFLGWYADEALKTPYSFGSATVTADTVVYAKWAETGVGATEYVVDFISGEGATAVGSVATVGGKLVFGSDYVEPTRDGYTFGGWFVSMTENGEKLSYEAVEGTVINGDTTLFAVWNKIGEAVSAPAASVSSGSIKWNAVNDVNVSYTLTITKTSDGSVLFEGGVSGTAKTFDFTAEEAGEYKIELTATKGSDSATAVRYYNNKALDRVYKFEVIDGKVLVFGAVANAEKYLITVDCGNSEHTHTALDNGSSTVFNFANCSMQKGGITFVVTAKAVGYADSVSETFTYVKDLDAVSGVYYQESNGSFSWVAVENAAKYYVTVFVGDNTYTFDNGNKTTFSVAGYTGEITISVVPATEGYNSPIGCEATINKTKLATPGGVAINGVTVSWDAVEDATGYVVKVNGKAFELTETEFSLVNDSIQLTSGAEYSITVTAVSNEDGVEDSFESTALVSKYLEMTNTVRYAANTVYWDAVIGSSAYEVKINDEDSFFVNNATSVSIVLPKAGKNVIGVRTADLGDTEWQTVEVYAYTVKYISRSIENSDVTEYVAIGDKMNLPEGYTLVGYNFTGWYNAPAAAEGNGAKYNESVFVGNGDLTLYANWTPKTYNVTVYVDETVTNIENESVMNATYTKDFFMTPAISSDSTRGGFVGWYTLPGGAGIQLTDAEGNSVAPYAYTNDIVAYPFFDTQVLAYTLKADGTYAAYKGPNVNNVSSIKVPTVYRGVAVTSILENAFSSCVNLVSIEIPDTITLVGTGAFSGCNSLQSISVYEVEGNTAEKLYSSYEGALIYYDAPSAAYYLEFFPRAKTGSYTVPEIVDRIRTNAFVYSNIEYLTISKGVTYIAEKAFNSCRGLKTVEFEAGGTEALTIENGAFVTCTTIESVVLPARTAAFDHTQLIGCTALKSITVEAGGANYGSVDGMLTNSIGDTIILCPVSYDEEIEFDVGIRNIGAGAFAGILTIDEITIPAYINSIEKGAFAGCSQLSKVTVDGGRNNALTIGESAFEGCAALTEVVFGGNTTGTVDAGTVKIGKNAFKGNTALTTLTVKAGSNVAEIGESAFAGNSKLAELNFENGAVVTSIGKNAFENIGITELEIHPSTESIGNYAFAGNTGLSVLTFAPNGKNVAFGEYVFSGCVRLITVNIPANVTELNGSVFDGCEAIREIVVDPANSNLKSVDGVLYDHDLTRIKFYPMGKDGDLTKLPWNTLTHIEGTVFKNNPKITEIEFGAKIVSIGNSAFENCINLTDVSFKSGITALTVGSGAFKNCVLLENITLPDATTSIGSEAFYMTELKAITLPEKLTTIGDHAFAYTKLASVNLTPALTSLGNGAFAFCTSLTTLTISSEGAALALGSAENTSALAGVFASTAITSVVIPDRVTEIGGYAFNACEALSTVTIANTSNITAIGDYAFNGVAIEAINLPGKLTTIGKYAFGGTKLQSVTIPASVTLISEYAFADCGIGGVTFVSGGTEALEIQQYAFKGSTFTSITLPLRTAVLGTDVKIVNNKFMNNAYAIFDGNTVLSAINVEAGDGIFSSKDGVLYKQSSGATYSELVYCPVAKTGSLVVPKTVVNVYNHALYGNSLTSISFEEYDKTDENYAKPLLTVGEFENTTGILNAAVIYSRTLTSISFPSHLASLGTSAVYSETDAFNLTTVTFNPDSTVAFKHQSVSNNKAITTLALPKVSSMGQKVFSGCSALTSVTFAEGSTLTTIDDYAFSSCTNLQSINIPASVVTIDNYAFQNSGLKTIVFAESPKLTTIGSCAFQKTAFETFTIPASVLTVKDRVFDGCPNLTEVTIGMGMTTVISGSHSIFGKAPALASIKTPEGHTAFVAVDGVLYDLAQSTVMLYPQARPTAGYVMPDSVTAISAYAFRYIAADTVNVGTNVTTIGNYAFAQSSLESISLPKALKTMGTYVFSECKSLTSVTFAANCELTSIGQRAFYNCTALPTIDLPDNLATISGVYLFYGCSSLETATLPAALTAIPAQMFYNCTSLREIYIQEGITSIGNYAFYGTALSEVTIPSTVTSLGTYVFQNAKSLKKVEFAPLSKLKTMGNYVFGNNVLLESIVIPENVTTLGNYMFSGCTSLKNVVINGKVTTINQDLFKGCSSLVSVELPDSVTTIGKEAFVDCTALRSIVIPANVTSIADKAFSGCKLLSTVTFEGTKLTSIGSKVTGTATDVFKGTESLRTIELPNGIEFIGQNAFAESGIASITLPSTLKEIGTKAFYECDYLLDLEIPAATTKIYDQAFYGCDKLRSVSFEFGFEELGDFAFENCPSLKTVSLPATVKTMGTNPFLSCGNLTDFSIDSENVNYRYINGVLYDADMYTLLYYSPANTAEEFTIPESVMAIGDGAFASSQLKKVVFPDRFKSIPNYAFKDSKQLEEVVIPKSVETIGIGAFQGCSAITSVDIPATVMNMGSYVFADCTALSEVNYEERKVNIIIGAYAFSGCTSIKHLAVPEKIAGLSEGMFMGTGIVELILPEYILALDSSNIFANCKDLKTVVLHENLGQKIGSYVFGGCSEITEITIPASVNVLGEGVFMNCDSLRVVNLPDTIQMYGNYAFMNCVSLESVHIPNYLYNLGMEMFSGCTSLKSFRIQSVSEIPPSAFYGCTSLETFIVDNNAFVLYSNVFEDCTSLKEFHVYDTVGALMKDCFKGWTSEQKIIFHGFESYEAVVAKYGTDWTSNCEAEVIVLPE